MPGRADPALAGAARSSRSAIEMTQGHGATSYTKLWDAELKKKCRSETAGEMAALMACVPRLRRSTTRAATATSRKSSPTSSG